ncbi:hypothetical protein J7T55_010827 [Diaporthe amygdali]|uniref:uncharacterized protein n=1 Tax=Phomopsis amygdali TaxID=1214568 RepID=UPI0022FDC70D|nr:uncharacterized protein J7T55_010827 [Diaporthe amygdali]KAJ0114438.1 hypothetical protein J7T55_010827 [Diaporthe amygdali]
MDAPGQDQRPRAVVFMENYEAPQNVPRELGGKQIFPRAMAGERGWAFRSLPVTGSMGASVHWIWVVVSIGGATRRGWMPQGSLKPGEFLCDSMPIEIPMQKMHQPPLQETTSQQKDTVLYRTLQGIWEGIRNNRDTFLAPIASQEDISLAELTLYGTGGSGYADLLYRSISPQLRNIMDQGHFNPREFLDPSKAVRQMTSSWPSDDYAVIYLMVSDGVQHGIKNLVNPPAQNDLAIYAGQGANGPNRCLTGGSSCHQWLLTHPELRHGNCVKYKIARTGKNTVWIPFMLIKKSNNELHGLGWENLLHVAELTTVILLKTWNPLVLKTVNPHQMGSYARDYESASIFRGLIDEVSERTG